MYSVEFSQTAEKQLYDLEKTIQERIIEVLERIKIRPFHFIKRKQNSPYFILRISDYRAILDMQQAKNMIFVIEVGHRSKIYED
ncbi:MAG: type II toxin-antitoxin system RelE/ParE family toxin [Candidatus Pacearchaeota archaeon]|nr:type II toxin-antitoxin system RelE/ParE family toxin [Candidatus Pacearchaeota archaeon]